MYFLKENKKNYFSLFYLTFFDRPAPNYDSDCIYVMWRTCNLTGPVVHLFDSCHEGPGFNPQAGTYVKWDAPASIVLLHW
jgi:hypothetical protein